MDLYIGIDPGASGGLACVSEDGSLYTVQPMPPTLKDILHALMVCEEVAAKSDVMVRAMLEQAQPFPKQGVVSVATYMRNFGALEMGLVAAGIRYDTVTPIKWMNALQCRTHGDKNISKARAQALFPDIRVTHAIADALLIAEYGRRLHRGMFAARSSTDGTAKGPTETGQGQAARQGADAEAGSQARPPRSTLADATRHGARPRSNTRSTL